MLDTLNALETAGHRFERLRLERVGENWLVQFAIDGRKYPPFYEPHSNVQHMKEQEFLRHLEAQSLTAMQLVEEVA